jgi:hypothetical protein
MKKQCRAKNTKVREEEPETFKTKAKANRKSVIVNRKLKRGQTIVSTHFFYSLTFSSDAAWHKDSSRHPLPPRRQRQNRPWPLLDSQPAWHFHNDRLPLVGQNYSLTPFEN